MMMTANWLSLLVVMMRKISCDMGSKYQEHLKTGDGRCTRRPMNMVDT